MFTYDFPEPPARIARATRAAPVRVNQIELVRSYTSGCGGPSYGWTAEGYIAIGDAIPRQALPPLVAQWVPLAAEAAAKFGLPLQYILGVIALESVGKANAISPAGAMGLMQVMPKEVVSPNWMGRSYTTEELLDPATNIDIGCTLLAKRWTSFDGDPIKIAFSYNAGWPKCGVGCVKDYKAPGQPCIATCSPNQFGLLADCPSGTTTDYGGRVAKYSNEALATGVAVPPAPPEPPVEEDVDSDSSSSGAGWFLFGLFALGGAFLYTRR